MGTNSQPPSIFPNSEYKFITDQLTSKPEIAQLMEWLDLLVSWKAFGLYLPGITYNTISKIDVDEPSVSEKKIALYIKWLKVCPTATWSDVITALQRMKEYTLAEDIKQKLQFKKTSQGMYNYL